MPRKQQQQPYWAGYKDLVFPADRNDAAIKRYFDSEGSLLIYGDTPETNRAEMLKELELSLKIRQMLEEQGRLFVTEFDFEAITGAIGVEIAQRSDYGEIAPEFLEAVKVLNESLAAREVTELFRGFGIMTALTGARVPTPMKGKPQQYVNAIFAHPDDAEITMFFRLLWEMVMNRNLVQYLCMFPGTGGGNDRGYTMMGARYVRTFNELLVTARKLGVPFVHLLATPGEDVLAGLKFRKFGLQEWTHMMRAVRAAQALGIALARTVPGNLWIGHSGNKQIDWHPEHSEFMGLLLQWLASFGQWVAYFDAMPDSRLLTMPKDFAWAEAVVWENAEKLSVNDQTGYHQQNLQGGYSLLAQFLLHILDGHRSQNGHNYGEVKLAKELANAMDAINERPLRSSEKLLVHAGSDSPYAPRPRFIEMESPIYQYVMYRLQWLTQFGDDRQALLMAEEPDFFAQIG